MYFLGIVPYLAAETSCWRLFDMRCPLALNGITCLAREEQSGERQTMKWLFMIIQRHQAIVKVKSA
jgi:hypothetical protein